MHRGAVVVGVSALAILASPAVALAQASGTVTPQDQVVLRGDVVVPRGQSAGEIVVFSGSATVAGVAHGDVVVLDGPITISGQVSGDVIAIHGRIRLLRTAQVAGAVRGGEEVEVAEGAQVAGGVREGVRFTLSGPFEALGPLLASISIAVSILVIAALLVLFAPRAIDPVAAAGRDAPFASAGWGLLLAVALPTAAVVGVATVLGLPFGLAVLLCLGLLWLVGLAWTTWIIGRAAVKAPRRRSLSLLAGWGIGSAVGLVPFVNVAWWLLGSVFGLGALVVAAWRARKPREPDVGRPRRERRGRHRVGRVTIPDEAVLALPETPLAED
jgi:cytoskeletal protein CcmA (bactofilin family)